MSRAYGSPKGLRYDLGTPIKGCATYRLRPIIVIRDLIMKNRTLLVVLSIAAASAAGCIGFDRQSGVTAPSATGVSALMGTWTSATIIPSPSACSNFKWNASEQTATAAKGTFSATCAGDLNFTGAAEGTLNGAVINWKATGNATGPSITACAISLTGTAELGTSSIRIPYSGTTCLGAVSGTETLRR